MANGIKSAPSPTHAKTQHILRIVFWILLSALALNFIINNALPYFSLDPDVMGRWLDYKWWLIGHISGGLIALVIGPFQFWKGLRQRNLTLHRWLGRTYLAGITLGVVASTFLAWTSGLAIDLGWAIGLQGLALAWACTTFMAYRFIRLRRITLHREWMIRSYTVTFAFVTFRLVNDYLGPVLGNSIQLSTTFIWLSWAVPVLVVSMILAWNKK